MDELEKLAKSLIETESYNKDVDGGSGYGELEDGVYNVKIEEVTMRESKAGNKGLNIKLRHENNRVTFVGWYLSPKTAERTLKRCMTLVKELGYEITPSLFAMDALEGTMKALVGESVVYTKTTNGEYVNESIHGA